MKFMWEKYRTQGLACYTEVHCSYSEQQSGPCVLYYIQQLSFHFGPDDSHNKMIFF